MLAPDHVATLLEGLARRLLDRQHQGAEREKALRRELRQTEQSIKRLYDAVAEGLIEDRPLFRRALSEHQQRQDELLRLARIIHEKVTVAPFYAL